MRTWAIAAAAVALLTMTGCGGSGDEAPDAAETVTVTADPTPEDSLDDGDPGLAEELEGAGALIPDEPFPFGPGQTGGTGEVTLHSIEEVPPREGTPELPSDRALVLVEWSVRNTGALTVFISTDAVVVEPDGRTSEDIGKLSYGSEYSTDATGSGDFAALIPQSVASGRYVEGYSLFEVPKVAGQLMLSVSTEDDDAFGEETYEFPVELPFS